MTVTPTLARASVTLITDPVRAHLLDDGPDKYGLYQADHEIVLPIDVAAKIPLLREDVPMSLRVVDLLTDRVLVLFREDEHTVLATVDEELTAELARYWAEAIAEPV